MDAFASDTAGSRALPLVTSRHERRGERVELSRATVANWVVKVANLMETEYRLSVGSRLAIDVGAHWSGTVWAIAALTRGWVITDRTRMHDVLVLGADDVAALQGALDGPLPESTGVVAAVCTTGLLGRWDSSLPWDTAVECIDATVEARTQPDSLVVAPAPLHATSTAWELDGQVVSQVEAVSVAAARAASCGSAGGRILIDRGAGSSLGLLDGAVVPALTGGSVVLCAHLPPDERDRVAADEQADVVLLADPRRG